MVVDYLAMSNVNFAIPDFCLLIPNLPSLRRVALDKSEGGVKDELLLAVR